MNDLEKTIEQEIKEGFNNFHLRFPDSKYKNGGFKRRIYNEEEYKKSHLELSESGIKWRIQKKQRGSTPEQIREDFTHYSQLYQNQSPKEFYETIDKTIVVCGFDLKEIDKLNQSENFKILNEKIFPSVYTQLRKMGYNRIDLWT
jgi:hypothetical protein